MRILVVCSGNSKQGISQIVLKQGLSIEKCNVDLEFFPVRGKGLIAYVKAAFQLRRYLRRNSFDIIHAHFSLCGYISWFARRREKLIISFMGSDVLGLNDTYGNFTRKGQIIAFCNRWFHRFFFDFVIVKSHEMGRKFGDRMRHIAVIPNGVDMVDFRLVKKGEGIERTHLKNECQNILFVSDPSRNEKNFALAKAALESLGNDKVVLSTVFNLPISELKYYYAVADVVLMTSFHEGSPNVIKEAMASNCNVVCTDVGDVRELFSELPNCWITGHDVDSVVVSLRQALSRPKEMNNSRDFVISKGLDSDAIARRIVKVYDSLLNKNGCAELQE